LPGQRLIGTLGTTNEDRHDDEPAIGELIVAHDGVPIVVRLAGAAEALEQHIRRNGAVDDPAVLAENRHARVHNLEHVISAHGERVVGWIARRPTPCGPWRPKPRPAKLGTNVAARPPPRSLWSTYA